MAINTGSLPYNKEILAQYINDVNTHVVAVTETNGTPGKDGTVGLRNYLTTDTCCREDRDVRGCGGGGVLIYVRNSTPCLPQGGRRPTGKGEMEYCRTEISPKCNYEVYHYCGDIQTPRLPSSSLGDSIGKCSQ